MICDVELSRREVLTVPNALTVARLVTTPWVVRKLHDQPRTWPLAAAFAVSDNLDGILARAGDTRPELARLGLRSSELGRKLDPLTDKVFTAAVMGAGMHNGVIPAPLALASLAQKAAAAVVTLSNESRGAQMAVSALGKQAEFGTNMAIGTLFMAESLPPRPRRVVRNLATGVGIAGVLGASWAAYEYYRDGRRALGG